MADLNPLTGEPLLPYQELIVGPASTWNAGDQGPRRTVVDARPGAVLPPWIQRLDIPAGAGVYVTAFVDNGDPGGTYRGDAQQLPDLVTTAPAPTAGGLSWTTFLLLALGVLVVANMRDSARA